MLLLVSTTVVVAGQGRAEAQDPLPFDPRLAPVVFLPGFVASELGCDWPALDTVNLWPGTWFDIVPPKFGDLALINTDDGFGGVASRTTSSSAWPEGCGSTPFDGGTAARHELRPLSPVWCLPEVHPAEPLPHACSELADPEYAAFGLALTQRMEADGRGQRLESYPWDWRRRPVDQVADFHAFLEQLSAETGSRVTVVAHSFGNTFYRAWSGYAVDHGGADALVGRFVSVAGPWWGVSTAWTHPAFGQIQPHLSGELLSLFEGLSSTAETFQSSPGVYDLFPSPAFAAHVERTTGGSWLAIGDGAAGSTWVSDAEVPQVVGDRFTLCPQSGTFPCLARRLLEDARSDQPPVGFETDGVPWVAIVGSGVPTDGQICSGCVRFPDGGTVDESSETSARRTAPELVWAIRKIDGDGNVPVFSAIQGEDPFAPPGDPVPFSFTCGIDHMGLVQEPAVLEELVPFLVGDAPLRTGGVFSDLPCPQPPPTPPPTPPTPTPAPVAPAFTG